MSSLKSVCNLFRVFRVFRGLDQTAYTVLHIRSDAIGQELVIDVRQGKRFLHQEPLFVQYHLHD